jgi:hypothetical protein
MGGDMEPVDKPHFLLVVSSSVAKGHYFDKVESAGATCKFIEGIEDLYSAQQQDTFHGIMFDIHSMLKLSRQDRIALKECCKALPTLKHFLHPETNNMVINYSSFDECAIIGLEDFVERCARLPGQRLRREPRYNIFMNVVLNGCLTNVTNISRRGSYILTTEESLKTGDEVSVSLEEVSDRTPIRCVIKRKVEWGCKYQAAGIGVEFLSMTDSQQSELDSILQSLNKKMEHILDNWDEIQDNPSQHILFMNL